MENITSRHDCALHRPALILTLFSLSLLSASVQAGITTDCRGSSYCSNKTLDASTAGYMDKSPIYFTGNSDLTVSASNAFNNSTGVYEFRNNTHVRINADAGLNGGNYTLRGSSPVPGAVQEKVIIDINNQSGINNGKLTAQAGSNSEVNAAAEKAITGGVQMFNAGTTLNVNAAKGVFNSTGFMFSDATLNLNAADAFGSESMVSGKQGSIKGSSVVNVNSAQAMSGGQLNIQNTSRVNINDKGSITGGTLLFTQSAVLNASTQNAITGNTNGTNRQYFQSGTTMNVNAMNALTGGNQNFNDATLNINAEQGVTGGYQILAKGSVLEIHAAQAVAGGLMKFQDQAVLNAGSDRSITGGIQNFMDNSTVNALGGNTLAGGVQNFNNHSVLNGNSQGSVTGTSQQTFRDNAGFNVHTGDAINGGHLTVFKDNAWMTVSARHGISGGNLLFDGNATLNVNADNAITGGTQRFKGNSVINLNHENALSGTTLTLEGNASVNVNRDNALNTSDHIVFSKTYDTTTGSVLDVHGHSFTVGSISGTDERAVIKNSSMQNAVLSSGLYNYGVFAGQSYNYSRFLERGAVRGDVVTGSALGDITRQSGLAMIPLFADRIVPEPDGMSRDGQGVWVRTLYDQQKHSGDGVASPRWRGHAEGIQIGTDLWPTDEDSSHKLGVYVGYLNGQADISGKTIYTDNSNLGHYKLSTYGVGASWRYLATQGWYTNTTLQLNRYTGKAETSNSVHQADIHGQGEILAFEAGYPLTLRETFTVVPRLRLTWQKVRMDDYHFDDLKVSNNLDNQVTASAGARLYWNTMTASGVQWSPFLDAEFSNQLATRDRNNVRINSTGYQSVLLTSYSDSTAKVSGGVTVKMNDYVNYYVKVDYRGSLSNHAENGWQGSTGISMHW
ncbi:autotransporter domain-containing protein [Salmonella enterica subsp. enterica serovar Newport]|nr:autotransporter domain-containing protein [Salmonella enterica subsp. enterica serovar Newport]